VIGYPKQVFAAGHVVTLTDVVGLGDYSLGVPAARRPADHATAGLLPRYTDS
jgi:hypothetical protein